MIKYILANLLLNFICWDISHVFCAVSDQIVTFRTYEKVDSAVVQIKFLSCTTSQLSSDNVISCSYQCDSDPHCLAFDSTPSQCSLCFFNITALYNIQGELFRERTIPITSGKPSFTIYVQSQKFFQISEAGGSDFNLSLSKCNVTGYNIRYL